MASQEQTLRLIGPVYILDKEAWWALEDRLDRDDLDFILHYTDDEDSVGLEFTTQAELAYFVLKYV